MCGSFTKCRLRVREIKRNVTPAEPGPAKPTKDDKNDTTQQPEQKQERNYSQTGNHLILASAPLGPLFSRSACSVGDHVQEVRMNCATSQRSRCGGLLPHLRQATL